jgi:hypothetical protein
VNYYVRRKLTFQSDKLVALSGIAQSIKRRFPDSRYLAGIWLDDFHRGLAWTAPVGGAMEVAKSIAPSWSWAHLDYSDMHFPNTHPLEVYEIFDGFTGLSRLLDMGTSSCFETGEMIQNWTMNRQGRSKNVCSREVAPQFFDLRSVSCGYHPPTYPESNLWCTLKPADYSNFDLFLNEQCQAPTSEHHQPCIYLLLGRWNARVRVRVAMEFGRDPILVFLILKQCGKREEYERVGSALISVEYEKSGQGTPEARRHNWETKDFAFI